MSGDNMFDPATLEGAGNHELILFTHGGRAIMRFRQPILWLAFEPSNAVQVGKKLIDCAVELGADVQIRMPRRKISDQQRAALVTRATHVLRSMTEKGKAPKDIALHVVDSILAAIE